MRHWTWHGTQSAWIVILLISILLLVSACETPSAGSKAWCLADEPIGIAPGDTEETKRRIVEHDRRLVCSCPEQYPKLEEKLECPER